jgi:hypothetical protein
MKHARPHSLFVLAIFMLMPGNAALALPSEGARPSAPPRKCEVRQAAWCIFQGAWEITDRMIENDKYDHVWIIRGFFKPKAPLVVMEPNGCRDGLADSVVASEFSDKFSWDGKTWNKMIVRLKRDGSCDLQVLIAKPAVDASADAYFNSLPSSVPTLLQ